jgi:iron-sulfur cluster biosynthesis transcriptional regulator SufR
MTTKMNGTEVLAEQEQPIRRRILTELKKTGGLTCKDLAESLNITSMGVRRHLIILERDGLVRYKTVRRGLGRPSHVYQLTEQADELFPKSYGQLTNELLSYVELLDGKEKVKDLFEQRAQRRIREAQTRLGGLSLPEKVVELARILTESGYLAEAERVDDHTFFLREYNCAIHLVAQRFPQACGSELDFIRTVLPEANVEREHHIAQGGSYCGYRIARRENET